MRIKSKWHKKGTPKTLEEAASVMGFIAWRAAQERADKMYSAGFNFGSQAQLLAVVGEFAIFLLQLTDRLVYDRLDEEQRQRFVGAMAQHLVKTMVDNLAEDFGPGDYRSGFIDKVNGHLGSYAEFEFAAGQSSYQALRFLAQNIEEIMGGKENKWVVEQVVEIEAPEAMKNLKKGLDDLLKQWEAEPAA